MVKGLMVGRKGLKCRLRRERGSGSGSGRGGGGGGCDNWGCGVERVMTIGHATL